ncbi:tRNA pseudouridine(13) synthase TruD [Arenimonas composti]|uniref:tRNA pseudouridine synthase D n=1 Tax=Arenimonas composti TR7-09 = DSM 18010 TaxID=1121013 RepID=A0A091C0Z7_9GAMM|nr:tRNA pseudouridine(13) synthase TruD [Arenimonas composti]KFN50300.1 hypothetical protein P873_06390 [Arenimonas composti TR7-09 = DSM 18010]
MSPPGAFGPPVLSARLRVAPEDFIVEELPGFEASGSGEHLLLTIEKRGMNTAFAARRIAQWAGVHESAIGYAGLKDRHAVTRQRLSVHLPKRVAPDLAALESEDLRVLDHAWHARKLPRGALAGNRFVLRLRDVEGEAAAIDVRLQAIAAYGFPNRFGEQRFGRDGDNVDAARRMFAGERMRREQRSLLLSAARSHLFNAVLDERIAAGDWANGSDGEVWMLDGTHSVFGPAPLDDTLRERAARQDIHPTGPLWGAGTPRSGEPLLARELAVAAQFPELCTGLVAAGLKQERRALRVRAADLRWQQPDASTLELAFSLPPGAYATSLLSELGAMR